MKNVKLQKIMANNKDVEYEEIKVICRDMFTTMENVCRQAQKEIEILDGTDFNRTMADFYCRKSLLFIDFISSSLEPYRVSLKDAQVHLAKSLTDGSQTEKCDNSPKENAAVKMLSRSRLSLKRCSDDSDAQDIFPDTDEKKSCQSGNDQSPLWTVVHTIVEVPIISQSHGNNKDNAEKAVFLDYLNLTGNRASTCGSSDLFEPPLPTFDLENFLADLKKETVKDQLDDYEKFEGKEDIDAVMNQLLDGLISGGEERSGLEAEAPANDCSVPAVASREEEENGPAGSESVKEENDVSVNCKASDVLETEHDGEVALEESESTQVVGCDCDIDLKVEEVVRCSNDEQVTDNNNSKSAESEEIVWENEGEEELSLEQQRRNEIEAIRELENIGCDTSDFDSSGDGESDDSETDDNMPIPKNVNPVGKEIVIETDVLLDIINSEPVELVPTEQIYQTEQIYHDDVNVKECSVVLTNLVENLDFSELKGTFYDKELAEIERLTNFDSLDKKARRRSLSDTEKASGPKRRRVSCKESSSESSDSSDSSDSDSTDVDCDLLNNKSEPLLPDKVDAFVPKIDNEKVMQEILNYNFNSDGDKSDVEVNSDDETDIDCELIEYEADDDEAGFVEEVVPKSDDEEEEKEQEEGVSRNAQEKNAAEPESLKRKKWRQDKLLTGKITDSSSDDEDDDKNQSDKNVAKKQTDDAQTKKRKHEDVEFIDVSVLDKTNLISLSSDSENSDVEFVRAFSSKRKREKSDDEKDETKKIGRRNIRAVKSDEALEEATKRAAKEEDDRTQRILLKQKNLDVALSQASTEFIHGLVLDVDEATNEPTVSVNLQLTNKLKSHQIEGVRFMWNICYESVNRLRNYEGTGCILAHCMGLGKTLQVITLIHTLFKHRVTNTRHVLIVCPLSTVLNWEYEFKIGLNDVDEENFIRRFCISNRKADKEYRINVIKEWLQNFGVLILGYEAYQTLVKVVPEESQAVLTEKQQIIKYALIDPGPDLVICDEGHLLKNGKNNRTKSLMKIRTKRRIILTGTPLQNNLIEYYYMVKFVKPNLLGTMGEYLNRFVNPITNGQYDDSTEKDIQLMRKRSHVLHKILKQTVQRYEVTELKSYLPEMTDYAVNVLLHPVQVELYKAYLEKFCNESRRGGRKLFLDFNNLRNVWTHPYLLYLVEQHKAQFDKKTKLEVDTINLESNNITVELEQAPGNNFAVNDNNNLRNGSVAASDEIPRGWWQELCPEDFKTNMDYGPKFKVLFGILEECERVGDKLLVFSNSLAELDCIEYFLKTIGTSRCHSWRRKEHYLRMDGTVPPDTRMKYCNYFNNPANVNAKVFLISHRVGGLGLNLVAANRIVLMDVNFNPAYDLQSIFRIYRFGQKKHCYVYRLVAKGTMEEVNYERSITKLAVAGRVIDQLQIPRHYKSSDLQKMYRFKVFTKESIEPYGAHSDEILGKVLQNFNSDIHSFHEHQSLLENLTEEVLNETEKKKAWDEFNEEKRLKRNEFPEHLQPNQSTKNAIFKGPENKDCQRNLVIKTKRTKQLIKLAELPGHLRAYKAKYEKERIFPYCLRAENKGSSQNAPLQINNCSCVSHQAVQGVGKKTPPPAAATVTNENAAANKATCSSKEGGGNCVNVINVRPPNEQTNKSQQDNGATPSVKQFKSVILDKNNRIIFGVPLGAHPVEAPKNPASEKQKESGASVIDLEREDLLKQISCNNNLTLSTVLVEPVNKYPVSEKSYPNVIEID